MLLANSKDENKGLHRRDVIERFGIYLANNGVVF